MCDAQHIGSIDGDEPERAYQDIPPSVARFVWRRDGGRCRVPGCRSSRALELHHIVHRADGGSHDASNIVLCCFSCHQAHHAGALTISGTAAHIEVRRPAVRDFDAAPSRLEAAVLRTQAKQALVGLGWTSAIAVPAIAAASEVLGAGATLEQLIFEALRHCPRPASQAEPRSG